MLYQLFSSSQSTDYSAVVYVENANGQRVYGQNFPFRSAVCVSLVRLCVGPLSLCLLYALAGIQTEQSVTNLTPDYAGENPSSSTNINS
jgi:hypothetical protein